MPIQSPLIRSKKKTNLQRPNVDRSTYCATDQILSIWAVGDPIDRTPASRHTRLKLAPFSCSNHDIRAATHWCSNVLIHVPDSASHSLTVPSKDALASVRGALGFADPGPEQLQRKVYTSLVCSWRLCKNILFDDGGVAASAGLVSSPATPFSVSWEAFTAAGSQILTVWSSEQDASSRPDGSHLTELIASV